jgi:hypothetical protein
LKEGENITSPGDTSKTLSGMRTDISEQDTIVQILIVKTQLVSQLLKFNFETLQWGLLDWINNQYRITRPAPIKYRLQIFDEERTDRSRWGPIDRAEDEEEEPLATNF